MVDWAGRFMSVRMLYMVVPEVVGEVVMRDSKKRQ